MAKKANTNLPLAADRLLSFVQRIESVELEQKDSADAKRDIYAEAKSVGYDVKTIRWLIQERKADAADRSERDNLRDTYAAALKMAVHLVEVEGLSLREAGRRTGASKSSIHRALAVPAPSHDPETGEIHDAETTDDRGNDPAGVAEDAPVGPLPAADQGSSGNATPEAAQSVVTGMIVGNVELVFAKPADMGNPIPETDVGIPRSAPPADTRTFDEIAGPIPDRLRMARA